MRRYSKPTTIITSTQDLTDEGSFDIAAELEKLEEVLRREVRNLMSESARGKLSEKSARDLGTYLKTLREMKAEQETILKQMPSEELKKLAKD